MVEITIIHVALISTVVLSVVFYVFLTFFTTLAKRAWYISLADGLIITFFILALFPMLFLTKTGINLNNIFFVYFWGFIIFHIIEKYLHYFTKEVWKLEMNISKLDVMLFIFQLFAFGFLIVFSAKIFDDYKLFTLLLFVLFISITSRSFKVNELFERSIIPLKYKKFITLAFFIGGVCAYFVKVDYFFSFLLYAFCIGVLLYISIRDSMDNRRRINPIYFLVGTVIAIFLIFIRMALG